MTSSFFRMLPKQLFQKILREFFLAKTHSTLQSQKQAKSKNE